MSFVMLEVGFYKNSTKVDKPPTRDRKGILG